MRSQEKIGEFLNAEHVGRISTIDSDGFPQTIPMNFVYLDGAVYMHSHVRGEKLDNVTRNGKAGFEVDRELEFLPSYFEDPLDASLADTLYVSVVIKGVASIVTDRKEKTLALNGLMEKYQPEGRYEPIRPDMRVLRCGKRNPHIPAHSARQVQDRPAAPPKQSSCAGAEDPQKGVADCPRYPENNGL